MTINALHDKEFLRQLDLCKEKDVYVKIISLDINEQQLEEIQGTITQGSLNIDGSSAVRRTLSLTISTKEVNITDYYWGFSTKFKVYVGLKNVINDKYDDIIWFNQGVYVITSFNTSYTTTGYTITIAGQDKMCLLNGSISGTLPGSIDFKEMILYETVYEPVSFGEQYKKNTYYTPTDGAYLVSTADNLDTTKIYWIKNYESYEPCSITSADYIANTYYIENSKYTIANNFNENLKINYYEKQYVETSVKAINYIKGVYFIKNADNTYSKSYDSFVDGEQYFSEVYKKVNLTKDMFESNKYYISNLYIKDTYNSFQEYKKYFEYDEDTQTYSQVYLNTDDDSRIKTNMGKKYSPNTYYLENNYVLATGEYDANLTYYTLVKKPSTDYTLATSLTDYTYYPNVYYTYEPVSYNATPCQGNYETDTLYFIKTDLDEKEYIAINVVETYIKQALTYIKNKQYYSDANGNYPINLTASEFQVGVKNGKTYYVNILSEDTFLYEKNVYYIKDSETGLYQLATGNYSDYPTNTQFYKEDIASSYEQVIFTDNDSYESHKYYIFDYAQDKFILSDDPYSPEQQYYSATVYQNVEDIPIETIVREAVHFYGQEPYHNIIINDIDKYGLNLMEYRGDDPLYLILKDGNIIDYSDGNEYCYPLGVTADEFKRYKKIRDGQLSALEKQYENNKITIDVYNDLLLSIKNNFLQSVVEDDIYGEFSDSNGILYVPISEADYFIYNNLLEEYNVNPTAVLFEDDEDYNCYTIAKLEYGEAIGYEVTYLTYPGELTSSIGDSLVTILDKIKSTFSNFEYFYDVDGRFVFQKKKDYATSSWNNIITRDEETFVDNTQMRTSSSYDFVNNELVISVANTPKFENVKNDFSVWGTRKGVNDAEIPIYGRMALDKKPEQYIAFPYTRSHYTTNDDNTITASQKVLITETINNIEFLIQYRYFSLDSQQYKDYKASLIQCQEELEIYEKYGTSSGVVNIDTIKEILKEKPNHYVITPVYYQEKMYGGIHYIDYYCDWRELIYQMAKDYYQYSQTDDYLIKLKEFNPTTCANRETGYERYYSEMISYWRDIYDTEPEIDYEYTGGCYTTYTDYDEDEGVVVKTGWQEYSQDKSQLICDFYLPEVYYDEYEEEASSAITDIETKISKLQSAYSTIAELVADDLSAIKKLEEQLTAEIEKKATIYTNKSNDNSRIAITDQLTLAYSNESDIAIQQEQELLELYNDIKTAIVEQNLD